MNDQRKATSEIAKLLETAVPLVHPTGAAKLQDAADRLRTTEYVVAVVGEFKRGKSSLVNALARRPDLMPVEVDIATSVPTTVGYGLPERACVSFREQTSIEVPVGDLDRYVTEYGNPANELGVGEVDVQIPADHLRGLVYADTPGLGSVNIEHTAVTMEYVLRAHVVLFVSSADEPLTTGELEFLEKIAPQAAALVVAVTKTDMVVDPAPILADTRAKISETLGLPEDQLQLVGVSARRLLSGIRENDVAKVARSHVTTLEDVIWSALRDNVDRALALQGSETLNQELDLIAKPLGTELIARRTQSRERQLEIERELKDLQQRSERFSSSNAGWRGDLRVSLQVTGDAVDGVFAERLDEARHRLDDYLRDSEMLEDPEAIGANVVQDVRLAMAAADDELRRSVSQIVLELRRRTMIDLGEPAIDALSFDPVEGVPVPPVGRSSFARTLLDAGERTLSGGSTYKKIGALVGFVGTAVGAAIAAPAVVVAGTLGGAATVVVGMVAGLKDGIDDAGSKALNERASALRHVMTPFFEDNAARAKHEIRHSLTEIGQRIAEDVDNRLRDEGAAIGEAITAVRRASTEEQADEAREAEIRSRLKQLVSIKERTAKAIEPLLDEQQPIVAGAEQS